jgi:hypothetical protein
MTQRITAEEARRIATDTPEKQVEEAYFKIRTAAEKQETHVILTGEFWGWEGFRETEKWKKAVEILKNDGYEVRSYAKESLFAEMYTLVKW